MKHKIFVLCLVALFAVQSSGLMTVKADYVLNGDLSVEEGATDISAELSQEKLDATQPENQIMADPDNVYHVLAVTAFEQVEDWFCGPATVKQVIHYLNGTSKTQYNYADDLGTTTAGTVMDYIPGVLNKYVGTKWQYVSSEIGTKSNWAGVIISNTAQGIPVVLDIKTSGIAAFPYSSSGHFVNTSGVDYRVLSGRVTSHIRITDPCAAGLGNRWYHEDDLYNANNNHMWHSFIH